MANADTSLQDLIKQHTESVAVRIETVMARFGKRIMDSYYDDYTPRRYKRTYNYMKYGFSVFYRVRNSKDAMIRLRFGPEYMREVYGGRKQRVSAEQVFTWNFEYGLHGIIYKDQKAFPKMSYDFSDDGFKRGFLNRYIPVNEVKRFKGESVKAPKAGMLMVNKSLGEITDQAEKELDEIVSSYSDEKIDEAIMKVTRMANKAIIGRDDFLNFRRLVNVK